MIPLRAAGIPGRISATVVGTVTRSTTAQGKVLVLDQASPLELPATNELGAVITTGAAPAAPAEPVPWVFAVPSLEHLAEGDIVAVHPNGRIDTLFRLASPHNALFVTDRCNSNCLMCSQPPKDRDDLDYHFAINSALVSLIPKSTEVLGITGGEPTLLGGRLVALLKLLGTQLPNTEVHVLTNGRALAWPEVVDALSAATTPKVVFGVPLYSDYPPQHDYVVQARDAFAQTILGLHNLARYGTRIEVRVVLHKQTSNRLPRLASFIHRNLPFAEHIAFMGLEDTGYAPHNRPLLWMDPSDYVAPLSQAIEYLAAFGFNVSIYNLQLCLLPRSLWPYCRTSISDWKRQYLDECHHCAVAADCGGVFGTSRSQSARIRAITLTT